MSTPGRTVGHTPLPFCTGAICTQASPFSSRPGGPVCVRKGHCENKSTPGKAKGIRGCFWRASDIWLISAGRFVFRALFSSLMEHNSSRVKESAVCLCESARSVPMCPASRPNWAHSLFRLSARDTTIYQNNIHLAQAQCSQADSSRGSEEI